MPSLPSIDYAGASIRRVAHGNANGSECTGITSDRYFARLNTLLGKAATRQTQIVALDAGTAPDKSDTRTPGARVAHDRCRVAAARESEVFPRAFALQ